MTDFVLKEIQSIADFNPVEKLPIGTTAKSIPMAMLKEFQRKIIGYEIAEFKSGSKFRNGDVLVAKITPCLENGKTAFVDILENDEIAFGSTEFIVLRAKDNTDKDFLYYFSRSPAFRKKAIGCMEGTSGRKRVNENSLKMLELPIPSLPIQKKIASVLSKLDEKIALNNQINATLEQMAKTLYDYWFVQFDFPDDNGKPYKSSGGEMVYNEILKRDIPKNWVSKTLGEIIIHSNTGLNPRDNFKLGSGDNYYITIKNIKNGQINFDSSCDRVSDDALVKINRRSQLDVGDILFTSIEPVGQTVLIHDKPKNWDINESVFSIRPDINFVTSEYLYMLLSGQETKGFTKNSSTGSIHKGIRHSVLKTFTFPYANTNLILNFTDKVKPILNQINVLQKENSELTRLRDWLLPMLMNGQVTVQ